MSKTREGGHLDNFTVDGVRFDHAVHLLMRLLGWSPQYDLEDGVRMMIEERYDKSLSNYSS